MKFNSNQRFKVIQGLRSFKDTLPKNIKRVINKKGHIYSETLNNWKYIVGKNLFKDHTPDDALIIDCQNHILCPGFIDLNANIGEPGEEFKENINTASDAALASGITSIVCMPNTNPVIDQIPIIQYIEKRARETNGVKIYPAASITKNLEGKQLTEMGLLLEAGAILFSEANKVISNTKVMKQALTYAKNFNATILLFNDVKFTIQKL